MRIESARSFAIEAPLVRPYVLSFTTLTSFTLRVVEVVLDSGGSGLGEVVALPGYGHESDEDVARVLAETVPAIVGMNHADAIEHLDRSLAAAPFARSAVIGAIEEARDGSCEQAIEWPQVGVLSADDPASCVRRAIELAEAGHGTVKVKVGRDIRTEIACARALLDDNPGVRLRFDANQAYSEADAAALVEALGDHESIELLEQPFAVGAWDSFERLASRAGVPLMQDESILDSSDIDRASSAGASLVKLKLCKASGRGGLLVQAEHANRLGLGVVLGNGVSGPIGNLAEARAWAHDPSLWSGAGEANGFAKLVDPILEHGPTLERGSLRFGGGSAAPRPGILRSGVHG